MQDAETKEQSAELLRLALPMMSRHGAGFYPASYAVWYHYVSGGDAALKKEMDSTISESNKLSDEFTLELYQRYVVDKAEEAVTKARAGLSELIKQLHQTISQSGREATTFENQLNDFGANISKSQSPEDMQKLVEAMLVDVAQIGQSIGKLNTQIDTSQSHVALLTAELERMKAESLIDPLSQVNNRRSFDRALRDFTEECKRDGKPLSFIMLDIDHFKKVNDTYGHLFGDRVITMVATAIKSNVKGRDLVARYGGEEYAVLLPDTPAAGAKAAAEQIRHAVERARIKRLNSDEVIGSITLSAGVTEYLPGESIESLIERADQALYESKQSGRNRVTVASA